MNQIIQFIKKEVRSRDVLEKSSDIYELPFKGMDEYFENQEKMFDSIFGAPTEKKFEQ